MGLLGSIVKSAVTLNQKFNSKTQHSNKTQEEVLHELLKTSKDTAFGKYYGFQHILESKDMLQQFQENVPIHTYNKMNFWWEQQQKFRDITWPGKPEYFAKTSGTTGNKSKRIPVTHEFSESMRKVGLSLATELPNFPVPEEVFESHVLMLSSSSDLKSHQNGHLEGEISGINIHNFPDWYDYFYCPGKEIAAIDDWDERIKEIIKKAPEWNVGSIAGIPSWVLRMLQAIMKHHQLEYIQDIWPNFKVYASGGVAFETYRKDFEKISNKDLIIIDTYLASEGFFAYTANPNSMAMKLAINHGYFYEFIPFDHRGVDEMGEILENPEVFNLSQVNTSDEYILVVSTNAGAWRYIIGDTIKFTCLSPFEIKITGRTKFFLNVFGSQLSEEKLNNAIVDTANKLEVSINEYMVGAITENNLHNHQWILVTNNNIDQEKFANLLDDKLKSLNHNYEVARQKTIDEVRLKVISKEDYTKYLEHTNKKGGQVKIQKVMKDDTIKDFLNFFN
ncbi:GH3 auxin-responsive promoter family protein [Psychroflexus sp. ALD_RP9]|uniref:GH3 family domain-containing protein n=1 Tax=Psychroflexus sp. ALD_RP9 TaxID=2777186 RepID=UPI001A8DD110|nr:GH3 auxin-responsive promoter family protein [Psychroflexus sp. ALD_RP9]QSS97691.1 GH3 auxin-responsive promoter family protein [Psychroflexus sp. ALD_RP9]